MEIAYAALDITPLPGEELAGYGFYINRRADSVLDPLYCRVCGFREGERAVVLVQLDLIGLQADHVEELRMRLKRAHGLPREAVFFHCTHTHTGPSSMTFFGPGELTRTFRGSLTKRIMGTVTEALQTWQPIRRACWFERELSPIAYNRDDPDGPVDNCVRGVLFEPRNAAAVALVNYACHPVAIGNRRFYSADYPGAVARHLAASGIRCVFLTAPCGDLDPLVGKAAWGSGTEETLHTYGRRIADAVEVGIAAGEDVGLDGLSFASRNIGLTVQPPSRKECEKAVTQAEEALGKNPGDGMALAALNGSRNWIERGDRGGHGDSQPVEVQVIRLGNVAIAGVAAELFSELSGMVRERSGLRRLLIAGTCNGVIGYIATRRSIENDRYAFRSACFYGIFPQCAGAGEGFAEDVAAFLSA